MIISKISLFLLSTLLLFGCTASTPPKSMITVSSPDFENEGIIPTRFTCDGENINPAIKISGVPASSKSLALIVDDPDAPIGTWTHWVVWNIDPHTIEIKENSVPLNAIVGPNSANDYKFDGPCPPSGTHRYFFKVYTLNSTLSLDRSATVHELENAIKAHLLGEGSLMGKYSRR